jgi:hypothetical protein
VNSRSLADFVLGFNAEGDDEISLEKCGSRLHQHRQGLSYSAKTLLPRSRASRSAILVMTVTTSRSQWLLLLMPAASHF